MSTNPISVAIIGGGLAALTLALCLAKHSPLFSPTIYELRPSDADPEVGSIALAPNALRVLDYVGIYTRISSQGYNYEDLFFLNGKWKVLGKIWNGSEKLYNFKALRVRRHLVRQALIEECDARGVKIRYGWKCIGVERETETGATVKFDSGEKVSADFVVGADGIHSHIRDFVSPGHGPVFSGLMSIGGNLSKKALSPAIDTVPLPCFVFAQEGGFAIMPTSFAGDRIGFFAALEEKDRPREEWAKMHRDKELLSRMLKEKCQNNWPRLIKDIAESTEPEALSNWPHFTVPSLLTYISPLSRIILIGDAAHAIPPTGGQGAAMAFEDAQTLAYALARFAGPPQPSQSHPTQPPQAISHQELLGKWNSHRRARLQLVHAFTTRGGDVRRSAASAFEMTVKEWGMWALFWWSGPTGGLGWLYGYRAEDVIGALL